MILKKQSLVIFTAALIISTLGYLPSSFADPVFVGPAKYRYSSVEVKVLQCDFQEGDRNWSTVDLSAECSALPNAVVTPTYEIRKGFFGQKRSPDVLYTKSIQSSDVVFDESFVENDDFRVMTDFTVEAPGLGSDFAGVGGIEDTSPNPLKKLFYAVKFKGAQKLEVIPGEWDMY